MRERPTGQDLIGGSLLLCLAGLGLVAFGATSDRPSEWFLVFVGSGLISTGILFGLTGAIVRALWFLPGESEKPD